MRAIILAAGIASRLRPYTSHTPKCLLKIGDKCLLQRSLDSLIANGIYEFCIVTGYLHDMIEEFVDSHYGNRITICYILNQIYDQTNNIYSLWLARPFAEGYNHLLLDSDICYDGRIISRLLSDKNENILTLIKHPLGEEEMKVIVNDNGEIMEINKSCSPSTAIGESLGIEKIGSSYSVALYKELDKMINVEHLENSYYESAFERLLLQGHSFKVKDVSDLFSCELDTIEDLELARANPIF